MRVFLEVSISATPPEWEILIPSLLDLGCEGFEETEHSLLCYADRSRCGQTFERRVKELVGSAPVAFREVEERNWNEEFEKSIGPIEVGTSIVIKPTWAAYENPGNRLVILIDPKMSFGTGYHETTRLVLRLLEGHLPHDAAVLDVGTGTGILAIASVKLGARSAVGIDIDEWAVANARENSAANGVAEMVEISGANIESLAAGSFSAVTANLTLNTNTELMDEFRRLLGPAGMLFLSGFLAGDEPAMRENLSGFGVEGRAAENGWIALAARKLG